MAVISRGERGEEGERSFAPTGLPGFARASLFQCSKRFCPVISCLGMVGDGDGIASGRNAGADGTKEVGYVHK